MARVKSTALICLAVLSSVLAFRLIPGLADAYKRHVFLPLSSAVRCALSRLPFSSSETLTALACALLLFALARLVFSPSRALLRRLGGNLLSFFCVLLILYSALWAPLYACAPMAMEAPVQADTLALFCSELTQSLNALSPFSAWRDENALFQEAARLMGRVTGQSLTPPRAASPGLLEALGASGIYIPFTFESMVSSGEPSASLPFTACHELAHQAGLARESEASYAAWLGCLYGSPPLRYSGNLSMLLSAMSHLRAVDGDIWRGIVEKMNPKVLRDFRAANGFSEARPAALRRFQRGASQVFLYLNGQSDGLASYDRAALMALHRYLSLGRLA